MSYDGRMSYTVQKNATLGHQQSIKQIIQTTVEALGEISL